MDLLSTLIKAGQNEGTNLMNDNVPAKYVGLLLMLDSR